MRIVATVARLLLVGSHAEGQQVQPSPPANPIPMELVRGRTAEILFQGSSIEAELLAVGTDSVWIEQSGLPVGFSLAEVEKVRVKRHNWSRGRLLAWNLIGGLGSSLALYGACQSVSEDCGGVFASMSLSWAIIGGISAVAIVNSSRATVPPNRDALRPFVRFPQGLPESYRRREP